MKNALTKEGKEYKERVKSARKEAGFTQEEAYEYLDRSGLDLSLRAYQGYERGENEPRDEDKKWGILELLEYASKQSEQPPAVEEEYPEVESPKDLPAEQLRQFGLVRISHTNIVAGAGDNMEVDFVEEDGATVMPEWLVRQEFGVRPERVKRIKVRGDSMRPTLNEGENAYIIRMAPDERVRDGMIYMIHGPGGFQVKRLEQRSRYDEGTGEVREFMRIRSDNPEKEDVLLPLTYFSDEYRVVAYFAKTEKDL